MATITDVGDVEGWIQHLMQCKQLPEADVKRLCEKVFFFLRLLPSKQQTDVKPESRRPRKQEGQ